MNQTKEFLSRHTLLLLLSIGAIVRVIFFVGIQGFDDLYYINYIHDLIENGFRLPKSHWEARLGLILPVYFFCMIFGLSEITTAIFPFLCSMVNIALVYKISEMLFNKTTAILSTILFCFFPLEIYFGTSVYATVPLETMCSLSAYSLLKGNIMETRWHFLVSGLFLGLAYLTHMTGLFLGLFISLFIFFFINKNRSKKILLIFVGFIVVFLAETTLYTFTSGDPLYRANTIMQSHFASKSSITQQRGIVRKEIVRKDTSFIKETAKGTQVLRGKNRWLEPLWTLTTQQEFGLYYYFICFATIYFLFKKNKSLPLKYMLLWFIPLILYLFYGTTSPRGYCILRRWPRYYSIVNVPAIIILGYFLSCLIQHKKTAISYAVFFGLIASSVFILAADNWHRYSYVEREAGKFMKQHSGQYCGYRKTFWRIGPFIGYDTNVLRIVQEDFDFQKAQGVQYFVTCTPNRTLPDYPVITSFETPKNIFVRMATNLHLDFVARKLWHKKQCVIQDLDKS